MRIGAGGVRTPPVQKRSISIKGHRTSIALEPAFWRALERCAADRAVSLPKLIGDIDRARTMDARRQGAPAGLASALRVFALEDALRREGASAVGDEA